MSSIKVGTDCSGLEAPILALKGAGIKYRHVFACDNNKDARTTIEANSKPELFYDNVENRDNNFVPTVDIYIAGFRPVAAYGAEVTGII